MGLSAAFETGVSASKGEDDDRGREAFELEESVFLH